MATIVYIGAYEPKDDNEIPDNTNPAWRIHQGATDYLVADTTDGSEAVQLVSSGTGRVSIGTHDPYTSINADADNLVVGDGTGNEGITIVCGSSAGDYGSIYFGDPSSGTQGQIRYEQNNEVMSFYTNTAERMRIDLDGDVGIDTTTVAAKLDVTDGGNDYTSGLLLRNGTSTSEATSLYHDNTGSTSTVLANRYGSASAAIKLVLQAAGSPVTALTALGSGNVGIGTTAPISQFHVQKDAGDAVALFQCNDASFGVDEIYGKIDFGNRNYDDRICSIVAAQEAACDSGATANGYLAFYTEPSGGAIGERMRISSAGKVGIGNDSPTKNLSIVNPDGEGHLELRSDAETSNAVFYLGTPFNTSAVNKTAIIAKADVGYSQSDLHFCLNNTDDNTTEVSVSDSRMSIDTDGVVTISSVPAGADTGGLILTNSNGGSETFVQTRNTGDSLYSYGFGRHRSGSFQVTHKANSTYGGAAQTVLLIDPEEGSHTNSFSEAVTGNVTDQYCAALKIDPAFTADSASTFTITNSNYISLQDPAAANAGSGDLNITNAPVFKLDAALGTHKATTNTDKSGGTASGTLKVDVNGTLYHIQLYAD